MEIEVMEKETEFKIKQDCKLKKALGIKADDMIKLYEMGKKFLF